MYTVWINSTKLLPKHTDRVARTTRDQTGSEDFCLRGNKWKSKLQISWVGPSKLLPMSKTHWDTEDSWLLCQSQQIEFWDFQGWYFWDGCKAEVWVGCEVRVALGNLVRQVPTTNTPRHPQCHLLQWKISQDDCSVRGFLHMHIYTRIIHVFSGLQWRWQV